MIRHKVYHSMPTQLDSEPAWDIARLFPPQGHWSQEDYFALPDQGLVEFSSGTIEVLPMPSELHQLIVAFLYRALAQFVQERHLGTVLFAPLRIQLWPGKYREPDVVFMFKHHAHRRHPQYWQGADLVMEVLSPDDPYRDTVTKRREYAEAGMPEYGLVDPTTETLTVLVQPQAKMPYQLAGEYQRGEHAASLLLPGFILDVNALFDDAET